MGTFVNEIVHVQYLLTFRLLVLLRYLLKPEADNQTYFLTEGLWHCIVYFTLLYPPHPTFSGCSGTVNVDIN